MNDLLMSGNLSERISATGKTGAIVTVCFNDETSLVGRFITIEKKYNLLTINFNVDEHDMPFKYFGLYATKAIINTGSENLSYTGKFEILKIEKENNYLVKIGAESYERNIRNESRRDS